VLLRENLLNFETKNKLTRIMHIIERNSRKEINHFKLKPTKQNKNNTFGLSTTKYRQQIKKKLFPTQNK
jgi:hypothetical protein